MYNNDKIAVHFELTDNCNARCPMCHRTDPNGLTESSYVKNAELRLPVICKAFEQVKISHVNYCGNYGDPVIAKDCFDIVKFFSEQADHQTIHTNGSLRDKIWWQNLAQLPNVLVVFGIDGIDQATHEYYRRNTSFNKIMENATAFNAAGGKSRWQFIKFKHNEAVVEQAHMMSKQYGFDEFQVVESRRFVVGKDFRYRLGKEVHVLESSSTSNFQPINFVGRTPIKCLAKDKQEVYVDAQGDVWPCCYIPGYSIIARTEKLNIENSSITDIIQSNYFEQIENSFGIEPSIMCTLTCGYQRINKRSIV